MTLLKRKRYSIQQEGIYYEETLFNTGRSSGNDSGSCGCGKKKTTETAPVEVTATPTPEVTKAVDMVDMQQTADEDIKNIMGEKTSTASKIVFVNNTGDDIQSLYIRTHVDEDSEDYDADEDGGWGDDLINGMFTLTDKDKALYYMQTANTQTANTQTSGTQTTSNKSTASYDIRIAYTDEDKNECFSAIFRLEQFRRLRYVWMAQMMMRSHMQNI